jgi:two-component system cell cycle sensor histidine kinase PleC
MTFESATLRRHDAAAGDPPVGDLSRADRILAEQVRLLAQSAFAAPINAINAAVVAAVLSDSFPLVARIIWVGAATVVVALRLELRRRYRGAATADRRAAHWARLFVAGSTASGLLWGVLAAALPFFGQPRDFVFVTLVTAGMTAGALTTLSAYFPAYLGYLLGAGLPLAVACLINPEADFIALGFLMLAYIAIVAVAARSANSSMIRNLRLEIANLGLSESLSVARHDLEVLASEKWSTLAHLSHELRTPLNAILGFSEVMRDQLYGALGHPRYREYAGHMHSSGRHLLDLVNDILDLSSSQGGALALSEHDIDVGETVETCHDLVLLRAERRQIGLVRNVAQGLPHLRADETKLRQILLNLLSNAIKFTPPGGTVSLAASSAADGGILIEVSDTGAGMSAEDLPRAMLPFVRLANPMTSESEGTGLGLPLSKRLAELHGATLTITSAIGVGTVCSLRFPAWRSIAAAGTPGAAAGS